MKRESLIYLLIVLTVGLGIVFIEQKGSTLTPPAVLSAAIDPAQPSAGPLVTAPSHPKSADPAGSADSPLAAVANNLAHHAKEPLGRLFLQLLLILSAARLVGWLFTRVGQPAVVGEMAAGILLGPSLFGLLAPEAFRFVFDPATLGSLKLFSQIGVCLFMFAVGMELDLTQVKSRAHTAVVVSHASIIIPYFLGVVLALFIYQALAQPGASFLAFSLFMGVSMSITAFPVLARILQERGLTKTSLGTAAITCAAVDDVTAWSVLVFVVAIVRSTGLVTSTLSLGLILIFLAVMFYAVKPALRHLLGHLVDGREPGKGALALVAGVVLAASFCTELIGIHALFGAFLAGAIMPNVAALRHQMAVRVENFSSILLLPLFFAFTGLRTQLGSLQGLGDWALCLGIIGIATLGKLGGSAVTARLTGLRWRDSLQLGALMNTRGLMELIALNLGYDLGILSPRIFTMLVLMALVTTAMTGPLLSAFGAGKAPAPAPLPPDSLPQPAA